jgi:ATP-dependent protease ClpP protease subunit
MVERQKEFKNEQERHIRFWLKHSGLETEQEVVDKLLRPVDTWLTSSEAKELGIIDGIIGDPKKSQRTRRKK